MHNHTALRSGLLYAAGTAPRAPRGGERIRRMHVLAKAHRPSEGPTPPGSSQKRRSLACSRLLARSYESTHASAHSRNPRLLRRPRLEQAHMTSPRQVLAANAAPCARARCSSRGRSSRCTTAARRPGSSEDPRWSRRLAPRIAVGVIHHLGDARQVAVANDPCPQAAVSDQQQQKKQQQEQKQQAQ